MHILVFALGVIYVHPHADKLLSSVVRLWRKRLVSEPSQHGNKNGGNKMSDQIYDLTRDDIGTTIMEGDRIDIKEVVDKVIIVSEFKVRQSDFYETNYVVVQIKYDEDEQVYQFTTSSKVLIDELQKLESKIPFRAIIVSRRSEKSKRQYYCFAPISVSASNEGKKEEVKASSPSQIIRRYEIDEEGEPPTRFQKEHIFKLMEGDKKKKELGQTFITNLGKVFVQDLTRHEAEELVVVLKEYPDEEGEKEQEI